MRSELLMFCDNVQFPVRVEPSPAQPPPVIVPPVRGLSIMTSQLTTLVTSHSLSQTTRSIQSGQQYQEEEDASHWDLWAGWQYEEWWSSGWYRWYWSGGRYSHRATLMDPFDLLNNQANPSWLWSCSSNSESRLCSCSINILDIDNQTLSYVTVWQDHNNISIARH